MNISFYGGELKWDDKQVEESEEKCKKREKERVVTLNVRVDVFDDLFALGAFKTSSNINVCSLCVYFLEYI